ncbi:MAG: lysophospholipid acyltransferase family protein [Pseudomonadota bacterium]
MRNDSIQEQMIDFTYSSPTYSIPRRAFIRTIEALGGQPRLKKLYLNYAIDDADGRDFFQAAIDSLQLNVKMNQSRLALIPKSGPVLFVANHPYGVIDGIALTWLAEQVRPDIKVLANHVLCQVPETEKSLLPIDFSGNKKALETNVQSRRSALHHLKDGGAIGIFPGGGVAASVNPLKGPAVDPIWHPFTAKLARCSETVIVPVYFGGQNSRIFQIASHVSYTLRLALYFFETARRIKSDFEIGVGEPIGPEEIRSYDDRQELLRFLRQKTFELAKSVEPVGKNVPRFDAEYSYPSHFKL